MYLGSCLFVVSHINLIWWAFDCMDYNRNVEQDRRLRILVVIPGEGKDISSATLGLDKRHWLNCGIDFFLVMLNVTLLTEQGLASQYTCHLQTTCSVCYVRLVILECLELSWAVCYRHNIESFVICLSWVLVPLIWILLYPWCLCKYTKVINDINCLLGSI